MTLKLYAILFLGLFSMGARCQEVALKSNLLYDAFATLNAGVETGLANRWTLDVSANYNGWTLSHDRKWKHWLLQPEARYWFCDRWSGHFLGAHLLGGQYNIGGLKTTFLSGKRLLQTFRPALPRMVPRRWCGIRVLLDSGQALESGGRNRLRIYLHAIRCLPLRQLRNQTREGQAAPLRRSHQGRGKPCIYILNSFGGYEQNS